MTWLNVDLGSLPPFATLCMKLRVLLFGAVVDVPDLCGTGVIEGAARARRPVRKSGQLIL
jgi:hypothetical protein